MRRMGNRSERPRTLDEQPAEVRKLCSALLDGLRSVCGGDLFALYLYGAMTFRESEVVQDIDFHVILRGPPSPGGVSEIRRLHEALAAEYPGLGEELDGYYILLEDARRPEPPKHQVIPDLRDASWALHRAHMLAGYCIVMHGPEPREVLPAPTWRELDQGLQRERDYVERHPERYPDYCVLNLCRIMKSYAERDVVVSKRSAAHWARERYPAWAALPRAALRSYAKKASAEQRRLLRSRIADFHHFACEKITQSRRRRDGESSS